MGGHSPAGISTSEVPPNHYKHPKINVKEEVGLILGKSQQEEESAATKKLSE